MDHKLTVLLIDDDEEYLHRYCWFIERQINPLRATTIDEARELFQNHRESIAAIVMDACVPGRTPTTLELTREIRQLGFAGPMIASSREPLFRQQLVDAGCSYQADKEEVSAVLAEVLNLTMGQ